MPISLELVSLAVQAISALFVASFTGVTVWHSRRQAKIDRLNHRLENLYTPLKTAIQGLLSEMNVPPDVVTTTFWEEYVEPRFEQYYHLASSDLQEAYDAIKDLRGRGGVVDEEVTDQAFHFTELVGQESRELSKHLRDLSGGV